MTVTTRLLDAYRAAGPAVALAAALSLAALAVPGVAAATIYRTVDEHGNVVFTDVPPKDGEKGTAVQLDRPNSFEPPARTQAGATTVDQWLEQQRGEAQDGSGDKHAAAGYQSLKIVAPADDAAVRENAGNVVVMGEAQPPLRAGDSVQVYLDGALRRTVSSTTVQLANVDRGTHAVQLRIVDAAGNTLVASEPVTFHLQRRSVLLQPPPGSKPK